MLVFVCGATGVLGRRVVRLLLASRYQVVGLSRSTQNTAWLAENGAEPRQGDLFDQDDMNQVTTGCEVFLHLATAIPRKTRPSLSD